MSLTDDERKRFEEAARRAEDHARFAQEQRAELERKEDKAKLVASVVIVIAIILVLLSLLPDSGKKTSAPHAPTAAVSAADRQQVSEPTRNAGDTECIARMGLVLVAADRYKQWAQRMGELGARGERLGVPEFASWVEILRDYDKEGGSFREGIAAGKSVCSGDSAEGKMLQDYTRLLDKYEAQFGNTDCRDRMQVVFAAADRYMQIVQRNGHLAEALLQQPPASRSTSWGVLREMMREYDLEVTPFRQKIAAAKPVCAADSFLGETLGGLTDLVEKSGAEIESLRSRYKDWLQ